MAGLTRALVARHALGRAEAYDAALLDVAQDHLLYLLSQTVQFGDNRLVFKGGTSLRKCRLGNVGRFSTDLDFSAPDDEVVLEVCELIDGARVGGFEFGVQEHTRRRPALAVAGAAHGIGRAPDRRQRRVRTAAVGFAV
ncbi:Hypothetical protein ERS096477_04106 [Mycobacterium tuberculosis]|nr:Hypothetical protein ERS096477_04106 [Mycobacterium tuberculosis]